MRRLAPFAVATFLGLSLSARPAAAEAPLHATASASSERKGREAWRALVADSWCPAGGAAATLTVRFDPPAPAAAIKVFDEGAGTTATADGVALDGKWEPEPRWRVFPVAAGRVETLALSLPAGGRKCVKSIWIVAPGQSGPSPILVGPPGSLSRLRDDVGAIGRALRRCNEDALAEVIRFPLGTRFGEWVNERRFRFRPERFPSAKALAAAGCRRDGLPILDAGTPASVRALGVIELSHDDRWRWTVQWIDGRWRLTAASASEAGH